jgi:hypothetical protein
MSCLLIVMCPRVAEVACVAGMGGYRGAGT